MKKKKSCVIYFSSLSVSLPGAICPDCKVHMWQKKEQSQTVQSQIHYITIDIQTEEICFNFLDNKGHTNLQLHLQDVRFIF